MSGDGDDSNDFCGVGKFDFTAFLGRLAVACRPHDWRDEEILSGESDLSHAENDKIFASTTDKLTRIDAYDSDDPKWRFDRRLDRLKRAGALVAIRGWRLLGSLFLRRGA